MSKRTTDHAQIEQRLLDFAYTTDGKITATALAYYAPCSIEDAATVLDALATRERVTMDVEDDGTIVYQMLGRQRLSATSTTALAPIERAYPPAVRTSPLLAAILSVFIPGAGHLYARRIVAGIVWFFVVSAAYALIIPGLILHIINIGSAATAARLESRSTGYPIGR